MNIEQPIHQLIDQEYQESDNNQIVNKLKGHTDKIFAIDICERKNLLVSGSQDKTVKLWNLQDNTLLKTYEDTKSVYDAVFSSEGRFLAYGGNSKIIYLIELKDLKNNDIISKLNGHQKAVTRLAFSNDEIYLISGGWDNSVRVWKIQAKEELFKFDSESIVLGLTMSMDDTLIVSHIYSKGIKIWNVKNQKLLCTQIAHSYGTGIQFSNDQQMLVSGGEEGKIKLWSLKELKQGKLKLIREFRAGKASILKVLLTQDSKFIISYCWRDRLVKVMDSNTGEQVKFFKIQKEGKYYDAGLAITKNMNVIVYGDGNEIMVWRKE